MITANEIRDLTADKLRRLDGLKHLLNLIDNRLAKLASQDDELANPKVATAMATGDVAAIFQALRRYRGLSPGLSMRASPRRFRKSSTSSEDSGRITAVLR